MTKCHRTSFEMLCRSRGYSVNEALPCVINQTGDLWTIDTEHTCYPKISRLAEEKFHSDDVDLSVVHSPSPQKACLPGAHLSALLKRFGIDDSNDCKCTSRAAYMDQMGCDWCEANIDEIVGWLRESAAERGLPFVDAVGRVLVRRAIASARKASKNTA